MSYTRQVETGNSFRMSLDLSDSLGRRLHPEAVVYQEDRNLVMSADQVLDLDAEDDYDSAYQAVVEHRPLPLGRYILRRPREDRPFWTYLAVVHDLAFSPTASAGNVRRSLIAVVRDAFKRHATTLAVEPLGCYQATGLGLDEMVGAFESATLELVREGHEGVHLILMLDSLQQIEEVSHLLRSALLTRARRRFRTVDEGAAVAELRHRGSRYHCRFVPGSLSGFQIALAAGSNGG